MNPFIQRMAEDMQLRNFSPNTIDSYTFHVDKFCQYFGKPADQLGPEQIREFQLYLVNEKKVSWSSFNQAVCGLRFLYQPPSAKTGPSSTFPLASGPRNCRPFSPTKKPAGYSNVCTIRNIMPCC